MAILKKNIWLAFYLIAFAWTGMFLFAGYADYQNIYRAVETQQRNITTTTRNSLLSLFRQYEVVLDMLAIKLSTTQGLPDKTQAQTLMDSVLAIDKSMVSFGIFAPSGELYVPSSNVKIDRPYNLLELPHTKKTFQQVLQTDEVVIGRTYHSELLGALVMPVRKAIRNERGEVQFVLSSAVKINVAFDFMVKSIEENAFQDSYLYRESDRYFQAAPINLLNDRNVYTVPIAEAAHKAAVRNLETQVQIPYEQIKADARLITHETLIEERSTLVASVYLKPYGLWLTTATSVEAVFDIFAYDALILLAIYAISLATFFLLFRSVANSEKKKQEALIYQANHDYLTQLHNRFFLDKHQPLLDEKAGGYALVYIDLDNFKTLNDHYGHEVGDAALKEIATRLSGFKGKDDLLVRFSGDEFIFVFHALGTQALEQRCRDILSSLKTVFAQGGRMLRFSASLAVTRYPEDGTNFVEIKQNADLAMYEAKRAKDTFVCYQPGLREDFYYQSKIEQELKTALQKREMFMVYQPQIHHDGSINGVEALIRWQNESLGNVSPYFFIPIAESSGVMPDIGDFALRESLRQIETVVQQTGVDFQLSVNVSVKQFLQEGFYDRVTQLLNDSQFVQTRLVIEITESVFIEDLEGIKALLNRFKDAGIHISLDDFGTGYSSLSLLKQLPIDEVKIDKSFVDDMLTDQGAFSMIEGIIAIANKLNIKTVAEGIETEEQSAALKDLGCTIFQGYYYSKPLCPDSLKDYVASYQAN